MAEINAGIPLSYNFGQTVGEHFKQAVNLADMMDQRKQRALEMKKTEQDMAQKAELHPLNVQSMQQENALAGEINPIKVKQAGSLYDQMMLENEGIITKRKRENLEIAAKAVDLVTDDDSYQGYKKWMKENVHSDIDDMPQTYGPEAQQYLGFIKAGYQKEVDKASDFQNKMGTLKSIAALPEGPEKEQAFAQFMLSTAPAAYYPTSPTGIKAAVSKIEQTAGPEAAAAGAKSAAQEAGKESTVGGQLDIAAKDAEVKKKKTEAATLASAFGNAQKERDNIKGIIGEIINSNAFATGLNPKRISSAVPGTDEYGWLKKVELLKSKLKLNERAKLKGQGQISDAEQKMLENAVSMLNTNLNRKDFIIEANRLLQGLDAMNKSDSEQMKILNIAPSTDIPGKTKVGRFDIEVE